MRNSCLNAFYAGWHLAAGAHLGGLFGCDDGPLCTAGTQHQTW